MTEIVPNLHLVADRGANMYLLDAGTDGLVLIDTGFPTSAAAVLRAVAGLGRAPADIRHIVCTHAHFDHIGSLAELAQASGASTWLHSADVPIAEGAQGFRPLTPAPGLLNAVLCRLFLKPGRTVRPTRIDHRLGDGDSLPLAGGLRAIGTPGHSQGQLALLWEPRRVLFTGDTCMNILGLGDPIAFEDAAEGRRSQQKLARLDFDTACFGHGRPILRGAGQAFRRKWGTGS